ncbi:MAG: CPBP family intramembrane metalloprotease [Lacibacter sp.]
MIGILIQLAVSWVLIWFFDKKNLSVLGWRPTKQRLADFVLFFLVSVFFCSAGFLLKLYFGKQQWQLNPGLSVHLIFSGVWWNIKSVLFEELIFRGVLLYMLITKLGAVKGIILSAVAFGIYHWFSFGVIGNPVQMGIVFIITGIMGLVLAYGYAKTFSLYLPAGIHFGWNLTQIFVFSQGPIGKGILIPVDAKPFRTDSYFVFFLVTFLPLILVLFTGYLLIRKRKQAEIEI